MDSASYWESTRISIRPCTSPSGLLALFKQLQKEKELYDFYLHGTRLGMSPDPLNDWAKAT